MEFTVYVLYSEKYNKHYTGYTSDFNTRFISHIQLGNKDWATKYRPWKVIHKETHFKKSVAMKREKWLKSGIGREFIKKIKH